MPENLSEHDERLGAVVFACLQAIEQGRPPDHREVLARHPEFADELAEFFAGRAELHHLAAPLLAVALEARHRPSLDRNSTEDEDARLGSPPSEAPVRSFGDYELLEVIGRGGNGVVYKARQLSLHRVVALKMILAGRLAGATDRQRFRNEAEAVAELDHPHIVPIYEFGEHDGNPYFSMKLVDGGSLAGRIAACRARAEPGLPPRAAARLVATVARAVHYAHQHGILHRDLKPANILLARAPDGADESHSPDLAIHEEDEPGIPYVTDFTLAKRVGVESTLTRSGDILGTPAYMAPEQVSGRRDAITTATDVYGLGAILYAALTARPPFQADEVLETMRQVTEHEPEPPSRINRRVDRDLETICLKCLDKDPRRRYGSAEALARDLERWLADKPIQARRASVRERALKWARRRPAIAALGGLVLLVGAAGLGGVVWQWRRAVSAFEAAQLHLYTNRIALADRYRQAHDADRADELLDECPVALRDWEWRYLKRRHYEDTQVYRDHDGALASLALSADGRYLVSVTFGQTIHVRDRVTGGVRELRAISDGHSAIALSPDGRWMAVGGDRGMFGAGVIGLWSTKTWSEVKSLSFEGRNPHALAFSPDSRRLVAGHDDAKVRVWDIATGALRDLPGHRKAVRDVAFSPDGRLIASASEDATIRIWDTGTYELRATLPHQRPVFGLAFHPRSRLLASSTGDDFDSSRGDLTLWDVDSFRVVRKTSALAAMVRKVCFSPDGRRLATAGWDRVVRIWDATSLHELLPLTGHTSLLRCLAFGPDGNQLISGGDDGIRCWDATPLPERPRHRPLSTFSGHEPPIFALASTPDGRHLISAGEDHTARVWDVESGRPLLAYRKHRYPIIALAVRPDGRAVATAGYYWPDAPNPVDLVIRIWDPMTGADLIRLHGHKPGVSALAFHPDGLHLASASPDGTVRLWDGRTGEQLHQFLASPSGWVFAVAFTPDGSRLAAADERGEIHVWDVATRRLLHVLRGHTQRVVALAFHPDSVLLASSSLDGTVRVWETRLGTEERVLDGARGRGLAWGPDGQHLAMSGGGGTLKVWDHRSGRRVLTLRGHADDLTAVVFTPDGRRLVTAGWDRAIRLWETALDDPHLWAGESRRLVGHPSHVCAVAVLPDGKRAISGGDDRTSRVWDIATGRELRRWVGSDGRISGLATTPDGTRVIVAGDGTDLRVWDIASGRELHRLKGPGGATFALAVTPDGRHALGGGGFVWDGGWMPGPDLDLHLWDIEAGRVIPRTFSGHRGGIWSVAVSPDGRRAASASIDGTARVWDIATGLQVRCFDGHHADVTSVAFLPDGERLLSAGMDRHLRLWDLATGREIRRFDGLRGDVAAVAISPDGHRALSGGMVDRYLRLWDLDTGRELYHYEVPHVGLTRGAFTRDGRRAIWAAYDGALRVWDFPEQFITEPGKGESQ